MRLRKILFDLFPSILIIIITGMYSCNTEKTNECDLTVLVVLAHPDDETLISGTLAKLISRGCEVHVVYATSGDDGPDKTGHDLHGDTLAKLREQEAL
jgi:N-acetylglucosamine malate deacetylase 2